MNPTCACVVLSCLLALAACETVSPADAFPVEHSDAQLGAARALGAAREAAPGDRTIWDGLPDASSRAPGASVPSASMRSRAAARPLAAATPTPRPSAAKVRGLSFEHEPLDAALARLGTITGAPILVTPVGRRVIAEQGVEANLELVGTLRLDQVLDLLVQSSPALGWTVRDDVIWVTTSADARGPLRLQMFDVRDLVMAHPNFVAPQLRGLPTGSDDEHGAEELEPIRSMEPDQLVDLIKSVTGARYWQDADGASIDITADGILLVRADDSMLRRIGGAVRAPR